MPIQFLLFAAGFGILLGSFGNVLIYRVPNGRTIGGRSACPHCRHILRWFDLIPVLSYLALAGRCRDCRKPISVRYPLVELSGGALAVFSVFFAPSLAVAPLLFIALWLLLLLAVIDGRTGMVPDALSIPFIIIAAAYSFLRQTIDLQVFLDITFAMAIAAGFFGLQWVLSRGRWIGSGDIFLAAGIGALLGTPVTALVAVGLSYILGALVAAVFLTLRQKTLASHLAFGPFLAGGTMLTLLWGEDFLRILRVI